MGRVSNRPHRKEVIIMKKLNVKIIIDGETIFDNNDVMEYQVNDLKSFIEKNLQPIITKRSFLQSLIKITTTFKEYHMIKASDRKITDTDSLITEMLKLAHENKVDISDSYIVDTINMLLKGGD
jgi:hypothetical protein